jgi:hypothetical protein
MVREDSLPLRILPALRSVFPEIEFKEADTAENLEAEGRDLILLDSALGIEEVLLIDDPDDLKMSKTCSMHDFDLPITIRILMKLKAIDSVLIIAIPSGMAEEKAIEDTSRILRGLIKGKKTRKDAPPSS